MAAEELAELHRLDGRLNAMKSELKAAVEQLGSHLMNIHGIGPAGDNYRVVERCAHTAYSRPVGGRWTPRSRAACPVSDGAADPLTPALKSLS
jgi:hypothetical protein